jgi:amino acid transporter
MIIILLCFAEIGSKISASGGAYAYVDTALGPLAGFITNLLYIAGYAMASNAAIANALLDTFSSQHPWLLEPMFRTALLFVLYSGMAWLNIRGTKGAVRFVELSTLAKLIPLMCLVIVGLFFVTPSNLKIESWPSLAQLGQVALVLFFAFGGTESSLSASGEIVDPGKTVPRGLFLGLLMVLALYIAIQIVSTGVLGSALSDFAEAPLAQVAFEIFGGVGITIILLGTFLSMFGTIAGDFLSSPRIFFAGSKQGLLPKVLARIHPNYKTPHIAIIAFAMITFIFSVSGAFRQLAILSSAALLTVYLLVCIATIKMRLAEKEKTEGFRLPFGISIPVAGIVIVVWFLSNLPRKDWFALFTFVAICTLYYFSALWKKKGKRI